VGSCHGGGCGSGLDVSADRAVAAGAVALMGFCPPALR
jgi:hypothetical protein